MYSVIRRSVAAINAPGVAGFLHDHLRQPWQGSLQPLPDPARQIFAGWILQAFDLVQVMVVQLIEQGLKRDAQVGKVHDPSAARAYFAADMDLDAKRVTVDARALVSGRNLRKVMRCFNLENAENIHGRIVLLG